MVAAVLSQLSWTALNKAPEENLSRRSGFSRSIMIDARNPRILVSGSLSGTLTPHSFVMAADIPQASWQMTGRPSESASIITVGVPSLSDE